MAKPLARLNALSSMVSQNEEAESSSKNGIGAVHAHEAERSFLADDLRTSSKTRKQYRQYFEPLLTGCLYILNYEFQ